MMRLGVSDLLLPGFEIPNPPGGDDFHVRGKGLDGQLKPHLVIPLAGAPVADGVRPLGQGDFHNPFGDNGAGEGGA